MMITQERLRELLHYDPLTGVFTWRIGRPGVSRGSEAGYISTNGYFYIRVDRKIYLGHRLAWFYMTGVWPHELDHRDKNPLNNKWLNLREATESQNGANKGASKNNKLGIKGVHRFAGKFRASITVQGKQKHLGTFDTPEQAKVAYDTAAKLHFGDFARSA